MAHEQPAVPTIDLTGCRDVVDRRAAVGRAIDEAFRTSGFMMITGHGVAPELIGDMYATTAEFFLQSDDAKLKYLSPVGQSTRRGFSRNNYSAASRGEQTPPDICEFFTMN